MEAHDEELVSIAEASRRTGVHRVTIQRRVRSGALASFDLPANHQLRLVRLSDVEALKIPVLRTPEAAAAAGQEGS